MVASFFVLLTPATASAPVDQKTLTICTSLKTGYQLISKTGKCNERIYETRTWLQKGSALSGTPGSKLIDLATCISKSSGLQIIPTRLTCNSITTTTALWQRPLGPPVAPSMTSVVMGLLGTATLNIAPPAEDGGARITSYLVTSSPAAVAATFTPVQIKAAKITGLTPGSSYSFSVVAINIKGPSPSSIASASTLAPTIPSAPSITKVVATGTNSAQLTFTAPLDNGGSPITSYTATSIPGGIQATALRSSAGIIDVTGLISSTSYTFTVVANNFAGSSKPSSASASITTLTPPPPEPAPSVETPAPTPILAAPAFTLSSSSETRTANTVATGFTITSTGGLIASFAINTTPAGMSFSTSTGALTGTPTTIATATTYTVTATNATGSTTATFALTVLAPLSTDSTLTAASTIKGQAIIDLGTPSAILANAEVGSVSISTTQAADTSNTGSYITAFSKTNSGATISRIVKYASGATYTGFATDSVYNGTAAITAGDFFIVKVTAADGATILYYKITVKLTPTFSPWANLSKPALAGTFSIIAPKVAGAIPGSFTYSSASTGVISIAHGLAYVASVGISLVTATFTPTDDASYSSATTTMTITVSSGDYIVGMDGPGGGKVFYVSASTFACGPTLADNCKFLESAPTGWYSTLDPTTNWSSNINTVVNTSGTSQLTEIGEGYKNSLAIIAQNSSAGYAATISRAYLGGTLNDWYLPAKDELNQMYIQRASVVIAQNVFWASTEIDATHSWAQNFFNGNQESNLKSEGDYVRPIRAFATRLPLFTLSSSSENTTRNIAATGFTVSSKGGAIDSFAINATPTGMSFSISTGALTGTPTTVAPATTYTVTATNASGTATATFVLTVTGITCDGTTFTCQVGDTGPGGGKIFYVAAGTFTLVGATGSMCTTNCKYLEAAPISWGGGFSRDITYSWSNTSNMGTAVTGADGTGIGTGYQNSLDIVAQNGAYNTMSNSYAAGAARAYAGGSKNDWFLPSKDELAQHFAQKVVSGGFEEGRYWSSTEDVEAYLAWAQLFDLGDQVTDGKGGRYHVRPVRAF